MIAFIEPRAPERSDGRDEVIEKILRHCGLLQPARAPPRSDGRRAPPARDGWGHDPDGDSDDPTASSDEPRELTCVDMNTFWATF